MTNNPMPPSPSNASKEPSRQRGFTIMMRLVGLIKPLTPQMIAAVFFGSVGHFCALAIPALGALALLCALGVYDLSLTTLFVLMGACALGRGVFHYTEQYCNHYIAFKLLALIRSQVFSALRKLSPAKLEGKKRGDLIALITSDIELLEVFYAHTISPILIALVTSLITTGLLATFNPVLGLIALAAYLIIGLITPVLTSRLSRNPSVAYRNEFSQLTSFYLDSLRGLFELLQYNQGTQRAQHISELTDTMEVKQKDLKHAEGFVLALCAAEVIIFNIGMISASVLLPTSAPSLLAGVILPSIIFMSSFGPVLALSALSSGLASTLAAGERVLNLLDEKPLVKDVFEGEENFELSGARIEHVDFSYPSQAEESFNETLVLSDISLTCNLGSITGIQGRSGSGKSTLLKLLMRFYEPPQKSVRISDVPVENITTSYLRELESYVTQETDLFCDTIANNIRIGRLNASDEDVIKAAQKASLHDFIMTLPQGYETPVGELGDTLSAGEKQRLGLARAFLHEAPLLLLDEPTSNLDILNEGIILKSLEQEKEERTIILVSHRSSTMGIADKTYSVEKGRLS